MEIGRNLRRLCWFHILPYWRTFVVFLTPILLLPVPLIGTQEALTGYVVVIMAVYWMTEALPLPVTSLLPIIAFPLLGIMNTGQVCMNYFSETVVMFIGGLMVGLAVEYSNLHKRIALRVLMLVGTDPKWLMMGFMSVTMLLSMFVSNTGACAMICPIVEALVQELFHKDSKENEGEDKTQLTAEENQVVREEFADDDDDVRSRRARRVRVTLLLSIAYSANIGGTGTLIGSTPQLALKGIVEELYGEDNDLSFSSWMLVLMPAVLISTALTWVWLQFLLSGFKCQKQIENGVKSQSARVKNLIRTKYQELGPTSFNEKTILFLFPVLVMLWMFRDPKFIAGWGSLFSKKIGDSVPVLLIILILFILPIKPDFWCFRSAGSENERPKASPAMLTWEFMHEKLPWGLVLLLGSGFALSDASKISGLSKWLGHQLSALQVLPPFSILIICCMLTTWMTEIVSNTATANIVLPILAQMADTIHVNPLYLMIPAAATCCYTFVLPVGTPANAIVYNSARMKPLDMVKAGIVTKMMSVLILCVVMETIGRGIFPVNIIESSLNANNSTSL
ncbi:solute carrier family 13 member 2-like [Daphnia pulex]|uniref:solute carrier family 13 member 2-like n=1 Tax=Daphnia pulex TaxID=6669 RepID=UPI001EDCDCBB|nr:solute carrier family 13 member 2-like [Daphnia pulex]